MYLPERKIQEQPNLHGPSKPQIMSGTFLWGELCVSVDETCKAFNYSVEWNWKQKYVSHIQLKRKLVTLSPQLAGGERKLIGLLSPSLNYMSVSPSAYQTSIGNCSPSIRCSDPGPPCLPQCRWSWSALYVTGRFPPLIFIWEGKSSWTREMIKTNTGNRHAENKQQGHNRLLLCFC